MERWRRHAIEELEASRDKCQALADHYRELTKTSPVIIVGPDGTTKPRRFNRYMTHFYDVMVEGVEDWINQLERGERPQ